MRNIIVILAINMLSILAQAGVVNGGGGRGVFCKQADGRVTGEALDLFEGREIWGFAMNPRAGTFKQELAAIQTKVGEVLEPLDNNRSMIGFSALTNMFDRFKYIKPGQHLKDTSDSGEPIIQPGCEYRQIINYYGEEVILVDREYFDLLDPQSQIALVVHELLYKMLRDGYQHTNSMAARKLVAQIFSNQPVRTIDQTVDLNEPYFYCRSNDGTAEVYIHSYTKQFEAPNASFIFKRWEGQNLLPNSVSPAVLSLKDILYPKVNGWLYDISFKSFDRVFPLEFVTYASSQPKIFLKHPTYAEQMELDCERRNINF